MKFDLFGMEIKIRKEYVVIGVFILFILLALWGWYLKTNKTDVFLTDEFAQPSKARVINNGKKTVNENKNSTDTTKHEDAVDDSAVININTADAEDLTRLNGIGEVKARAIVEYREKNGLFKSIEEIKNVKGIGEATYLKIKDFITVEESENK